MSSTLDTITEANTFHERDDDDPGPFDREDNLSETGGQSSQQQDTPGGSRRDHRRVVKEPKGSRSNHTRRKEHTSSDGFLEYVDWLGPLVVSQSNHSEAVRSIVSLSYSSTGSKKVEKIVNTRFGRQPSGGFYRLFIFTETLSKTGLSCCSWRVLVLPKSARRINYLIAAVSHQIHSYLYSSCIDSSSKVADRILN